MTLVIAALVAYLIGSISFAVLVSRVFQLPDPRSYGSGNPGATNVLRTGRKAAAALTLAGDALKGWFAVMVTQQHVVAEPAAVGAAAVAVVVGHMWPVFFRFEGGKGVSATFGALVALDLYLAAGAIATWTVIALFFRISSFAALVSAAFAVFFAWFLYGMGRFAFEPAVAVTAIAALLVWRHRDNIRNLIAGTESRISSRSSGLF